MKQLFLPLCALILMVTSCTKDDLALNNSASTDTSTPKHGESIIPELTGSYKLVKALLKVDIEQRDITNEAFRTCEQDDIRTLKSDNSYEVLDEGEECSSAQWGTWEMISPTNIKIGDTQYTITRFDGKQLELSMDKGSEGIYTEIWEKQ